MTCLEFQQMQPKEKIIHHEVLLRPWKAVGAHVFHFNNINYLSDAGTNFVSEKFRCFCRSINIEQAVSLAYHHQSNGQVKAGIKFKKQTLKKMHQIRQGQKYSTVASAHNAHRPRPAKPGNNNV